MRPKIDFLKKEIALRFVDTSTFGRADIFRKMCNFFKNTIFGCLQKKKPWKYFTWTNSKYSVALSYIGCCFQQSRPSQNQRIQSVSSQKSTHFPSAYSRRLWVAKSQQRSDWCCQTNSWAHYRWENHPKIKYVFLRHSFEEINDCLQFFHHSVIVFFFRKNLSSPP